MLDRQWKRLAREWLWALAAVIAATLYVWISWSSSHLDARNGVDALTEGLFLGLLLYLALGVLRLTVWSIRTLVRR